ncbi:hypothetical protein ILUMI_26008 [Ignelater luminosus]|uniref:Reverse transcriptase domain-containing protein n=1 Tax=Ignelater luminosus TaxID=2038154 RepID=A0A8K0CAK1_IGNLU|nr:hypothetical protein ILUMI_26008 [Ignelater luminosus]
MKDPEIKSAYMNCLDQRRENYEKEEMWEQMKIAIVVCGTIKAKAKKTAWKKYLQSKNENDNLESISGRNEAELAVRQAKTEIWEELCKEIKERFIGNKDNKMGFWTIVNNLRRKYGNQIWRIKDADGKFDSELVNQSEVHRAEKSDRREISEEGDITQEEVDEAKGKIKLNKFAGRDEICPEIIKYGGDKQQRTGEGNKPLYVALLDMLSAFDTVPKTALWKAMEQMEIHETLITATKRLYKGAREFKEENQILSI